MISQYLSALIFSYTPTKLRLSVKCLVSANSAVSNYILKLH